MQQMCKKCCVSSHPVQAEITLNDSFYFLALGRFVPNSCGDVAELKLSNKANEFDITPCDIMFITFSTVLLHFRKSQCKTNAKMTNIALLHHYSICYTPFIIYNCFFTVKFKEGVNT